ncbi:histidine kinase [Cupriavidus gilardii]|uniref:hypothetical protein n=1 Tax=Cupriavidus gilardii TaxID=82541 RepID=UPI001478A4E1|nr:hypothetical protein [Cupriavidus gilardii]MCT9052060.1 hypothetical protein [Cupriavidus gilardii]WNG70406.1 hypothetical protein QWJ31_09245 [Cupriavidus gilardii]
MSVLIRMWDRFARLAAWRRRWARSAARRGDPVWRAVVHGLAHDLRVPPTDMLALAGLYRAGALAGPAFTAQVVAHAREALNRVDELGCLIEEAVHSYCREPIDLAALVAGCVDAAWSAADEAGVILHCQALPTVAWVEGDARMLEMAVTRLLARAILNSSPGAAVHLRIGISGRACSVEVATAAASPDEVVAALTRSTPAGMFVRRVMRCHRGKLTLGKERGAAIWRLVLPQSKKAPEGAFLPLVR